MFKRLLIIFFVFGPFSLKAQDFSDVWEGYFSYFDIKDVAASGDKIYAVAENAVFTYDILSHEINTFSTINGLAGETVSSLHYSAEYGAIVIGYDNGLIEIVLEETSEVLTVVDILEKSTIATVDKQINHFNEYNGLLYISTNYGISVYDLSRLEFGDTYFIGDSGNQAIVTQTTISNGYIYASCMDNTGLKRALLDNSNLIDYNQWTKISTGNFSAVQAVSDNVYAVNSSRTIFKVDDLNLTSLNVFPSAPVDVKSANNELIITTANHVYLYSSTFNLIEEVDVNDDLDTNYTSAITTVDNFYIGSDSFGILKTSIGNTSTFEEIHPDGPLLNTPFSIEANYNNVWVTFKNYSETYNPYPLSSQGISHLKNESWKNISIDSILGARNLNEISINPNKINQVFISSFFDGILEVNADVATMLHDETNSGMEPIAITGSTDIRVSASTFDSAGLLWSLSRAPNPLKSYNPNTGEWQSYSFEGLYSDELSGEWGFSDIAIDDSGVVWAGGYINGLIGYDYKSGTSQIRSLSEESDNMPSSVVNAVAVDNQNQIWIGTVSGLRVLYNTSSFFTNSSVIASEIIILDEDDIASELLSLEYITSIEVDGSNNKWIGTIGSGLFYLSSDGQETLFHFTKENSPLPSNNVTDISIDSTIGKIFIATDNGLVSYNSGSSSTKDTYNNAYVYPNPVRPTFNITQDLVKIKGLTDNVNIKILDVEGNLVAEAQSGVNSRYSGYNLEIDGGSAFWNGRNLANHVVHSGVYLIMLSDTETFETKVLKLMIIR